MLKRSALALAVLTLFTVAATPAGARIHRQVEMSPAEVLPVTTIGDAEATVVGDYLHDAEAHEVGDFIAATAAAELDTFLASLYVAPAPAVTYAPSYSAPASSGEVGECTGFSIPSYIIQRESGGSSTAMNPSGAYGCAQTLLSHYYGGSCSGLDPYTLDGQRACVNILSDGGTNLSPWAMTR